MIGQLFDTYWLAQFGDRFYIIDQHAAHEKIWYERLVKQFREHTVDSQYLSPPLVVSLNLQEEGILNANKDYFRSFGFEIEPFGGREYCVSAVPDRPLRSYGRRAFSGDAGRPRCGCGTQRSRGDHCVEAGHHGLPKRR